MGMLSQIPDRQPRRGELDHVLDPHTRHRLREIYRELQELQRRATVLNSAFLAQLIAAAADEARDQLRDDLMMREAAGDPAARGELAQYEE
jgi:hypothetical protein